MRQSRCVHNRTIKLTLTMLTVLLLGSACSPAGCVRVILKSAVKAKVSIISPEDQEELPADQLVHFEAELSGFTAVETSWTSSIDGKIPSAPGSTSTDYMLSPGTHTITFSGAYEDPDPEQSDPLVPISKS